MKLALLAVPLLLFGCSVRTLAQTAVRADPYPVFTTAGNVPIGSSAPVLTVPGSTIKICTDSACNTRAQTYLDAGATMPCSLTAQVVLPGSTVCQSTTDNQGAFGFWLLPGTYYYTVALPPPISATMGPFPLTTGLVGTTGVQAFNGRTGLVFPVSNDYSYFQIGGTRQGSSTVPQMAGGNNGLMGALLCNDSSGNTTTSFCNTGTGVTSFNGRAGAVLPQTADYTYSQIGGSTQGNTTKPQMAGTNSGSTGALLCNDASGNATTSGCSATSGVSSFNSRTGVVVPTSGDYTYSQIGGAVQGNTTKPQMAGTNSGMAGATLCDDANGNATTTGCSGGGAGSPFTDATAILFNAADSSKLLKFALGGFTTATTRTLTPQNASYTIAGTDITNSFSAVQSFAANLTFANGSVQVGTTADPANLILSNNFFTYLNLPSTADFCAMGLGGFACVDGGGTTQFTVAPSTGAMLSNSLSGTGFRCLHTSSTGAITPTSSDCGAGGGGGVTAVTASDPLVSSGGTAPNITCPTCNEFVTGQCAQGVLIASYQNMSGCSVTIPRSGAWIVFAFAQLTVDYQSEGAALNLTVNGVSDSVFGNPAIALVNGTTGQNIAATVGGTRIGNAFSAGQVLQLQAGKSINAGGAYGGPGTLTAIFLHP